MMNLYLDLRKAVSQVPSTATGTPSDRQAARNYNESFNRQSSGVTADPKASNNPSSNTDSSVDDELEEDRKRDTQVAQERGTVAKPSEETKKSEAVEILQAFNKSLQDQISVYMPNETEIEYLTTQCYDSDGQLFTRDDVVKGLARIEGYERSKFNSWLHRRLRDSIGKLSR